MDAEAKTKESVADTTDSTSVLSLMKSSSAKSFNRFKSSNLQLPWKATFNKSPYILFYLQEGYTYTPEITNWRLR